MDDAEEYERPESLVSPCGNCDMDNAVAGFLVIAEGDCHAKATPANPIDAEKSTMSFIVIDSCLRRETIFESIGILPISEARNKPKQLVSFVLLACCNIPEGNL